MGTYSRLILLALIAAADWANTATERRSAPAQRETIIFEDDPILIVEDNVYLALDLSNAIEDQNGRVVGPVRTVADALSLLKSEAISGAVLDDHLDDRDALSMAAHLADRGVPFVIHTNTDLPADLIARHPGVPILKEPLHPASILDSLVKEIDRLRAAARTAETLLD
ncbi:MAG: hypothetical protein ACJ8FC_05160 [Sphingomicrobium sp.]